MTGKPPWAPVPTTNRRHFQGIASAKDNGVCPKASRNFLDLVMTAAPNCVTNGPNAGKPSTFRTKTDEDQEFWIKGKPSRYRTMTDEEAQAFFANVERDEDGNLMCSPDYDD